MPHVLRYGTGDKTRMRRWRAIAVWLSGITLIAPIGLWFAWHAIRPTTAAEAEARFRDDLVVPEGYHVIMVDVRWPDYHWEVCGILLGNDELARPMYLEGDHHELLGKVEALQP